MFRGLLQYVPLVPLILAVLLFVLMPFDEARADQGELVQVAAMAYIVTPCDIAVRYGNADFAGAKNRLPFIHLPG